MKFTRNGVTIDMVRLRLEEAAAWQARRALLDEMTMALRGHGGDAGLNDAHAALSARLWARECNAWREAFMLALASDDVAEVKRRAYERFLRSESGARMQTIHLLTRDGEAPGRHSVNVADALDDLLRRAFGQSEVERDRGAALDDVERGGR